MGFFWAIQGFLYLAQLGLEGRVPQLDMEHGERGDIARPNPASRPMSFLLAV